MKKYAFYMVADSGEKFDLCENGFGIGRTLYVFADDAQQAEHIFSKNASDDLPAGGAREITENEDMADFAALPIFW